MADDSLVDEAKVLVRVEQPLFKFHVNSGIPIIEGLLAKEIILENRGDCITDLDVEYINNANKAFLDPRIEHYLSLPGERIPIQIRFLEIPKERQFTVRIRCSGAGRTNYFNIPVELPDGLNPVMLRIDPVRTVVIIVAINKK